MQASPLPLPEQLPEEGKWFVVEQSRAICTQIGGDWKSYPHISGGAKQWREHMRPSVEKISALVEGLGIYLQCPFEGCNMQDSFVDHITSTNGSHFKALYQRNIPCADGVPIAHLRETAWQQISIRGGAVRFNHLDWEVQMWRGAPPPPPGVPGSHQTQNHPAVDNATFMLTGEQTRSEEIMRLPSSMETGPINLADLQQEDEWFVVMESASIPISQTGGWQAIPHIAGGKRHWSETMKGHATRVARLLEAYGLNFLDCSLCPAGRGWEEHIPGPKHYDKINEILGDNLLISEVKERAWQQWNIQRGSVRFNHLDGEIQIRKNGTRARQSIEMSPIRPIEQSYSKPMPPHAQQVSAGAVKIAESRTFALQACPLAKCMWRQRLPNIVSRLRRYVMAVGLQEQDLRCQLCKSAPITAGFQAHLGSDEHIDNIAQTLKFLENPCLSEGKDGEEGPRVQKIPCRSGHIWFNHITGESGLCLSLDQAHVMERAGSEWQFCNGHYWYNRDTRHYFEVVDDKGYDKGLWHHREVNLEQLPIPAVANIEGPRTEQSRVW